MNAVDYSIIVINISREEIISCDIGRTLTFLLSLIDTPENTRLYKEKLVLVIDGYNHDSRDLYEIAEVREFYKQLSNHWPHWFWFLYRGHGLALMTVAMFADGLEKKERTPRGQSVYFPGDEFKRITADLLLRSSHLFKFHAIPLDELNLSFNSLINKFS